MLQALCTRNRKIFQVTKLPGLRKSLRFQQFWSGIFWGLPRVFRA